MRTKLFQYLTIILLTTIGVVGQSKDILKYVDTTIGTEDGGGATFLGACTPHGMVKLGPDTPLPQNTSGYDKKRTSIFAGDLINACLTHDDLMNNNELKLIMTNNSSVWGSKLAPPSTSEILNKI